jgi:hypothetical protein
MHRLALKSSANGKTRKPEKAVYPSPFTPPGKNLADRRLNCEHQFFGSLSEIISLLENEWAHPENYNLFG